jgi:hypothetical protein
MRIRLNSPDITGHGTKIVDLQSGETVQGVVKAEITIQGDRLNQAALTLEYVSADVVANAEFQMIHPVTRKITRIKSIEFEDGVWRP